MHSLERLQLRAKELEDKIKSSEENKALAKMLIAGASETVDYSYKKERDMQWFVEYIKELERRI